MSAWYHISVFIHVICAAYLGVVISRGGFRPGSIKWVIFHELHFYRALEIERPAVDTAGPASSVVNE